MKYDLFETPVVPPLRPPPLSLCSLALAEGTEVWTVTVKVAVSPTTLTRTGLSGRAIALPSASV